MDDNFQRGTARDRSRGGNQRGGDDNRGSNQRYRSDRKTGANHRGGGGSQRGGGGGQRGGGGYQRGRGSNRRDGTVRDEVERDPRINSNSRMGQTFANPENNKIRKKHIGFKILEEISQSDSPDALVKLTQRKEAFMELIESPTQKCDMVVLIVECMAKISQSSFDELKLAIVRDTCNSNFIASLKNFLVDLPYTEIGRGNELYWKNPEVFWNNLIIFLENIVCTSPTLALDKCRSLAEASLVACLDGLRNRHAYDLPEQLANKLNLLRDKLNSFETYNKQKQNKRCTLEDYERPPEHFRELSVMPTIEDLYEKKPFVRSNIVDGAYQDIEHYLDVQFRLLREDCLDPLRKGFGQYLQNPTKGKYDNIRVYNNVKFVRPYISRGSVGSLAQVDLKSNKQFKRINWNTSKRFIHGTLLLFVTDDMKTLLVGTVLDRDTIYVSEGLIPVSLKNEKFDKELYGNGKSYTMIESEVYFEPYYQVMRAMQNPVFDQQIPLQDYIVHVKTDIKHPSYLQPDTVFKIDINPEKILDEGSSKQFEVLQDAAWPDRDELQFDDSQLEAFRLGLTRELAIIQGPPGTGKTYLGIKLARTLCENLKSSKDGCLILVVCYTNHALDQFLEALLPVTPSIVRIGGQSRNEAMVPINLTTLQKNANSSSDVRRLFSEKNRDLFNDTSSFNRLVVKLDVLLHGVIKESELSNICKPPEMEFIRHEYEPERGDVLHQWLFEGVANYYGDISHLLGRSMEANAHVDHAKQTRQRTGVQLNNHKGEKERNQDRSNIASFSIADTNAKIQELIVSYHSTNNAVQKENHLREITYLNAMKDLFNDMSQHRTSRINGPRRTWRPRMALANRWIMYFSWIAPEVRRIILQIHKLQDKISELSMQCEELSMLRNKELIEQKKIIGMTTSGAARCHKLLQSIKPPIVIVEEAAEVFEQHIITSLTNKCKHLILIGDHQQLRPSASSQRLAKHYKLEVSLFERMIANGLDSRRLGVQHRMRPEIAALICPHIYPDLKNHPSVYDFPDVKGVDKNLFFFTHQHREDKVEDNQSHSNEMEADLVLALANYLIQQGYSAEDVTVLAAYKGQMFYMRKKSGDYCHLKDVNITVVDNYQGEESKIILLSLVRNNDDNNIGFLGTPNRICVALSRAKEGFYIFGNMENLKTSELWCNIATTLEQSGSLGTSITLRCQIHGTITEITKLEDFTRVPEGGCTEVCDAPLQRCAHRCRLHCHGYDRQHNTEQTRCQLQCERVLCDLGHVCPKLCYRECGPCEQLILKKLPCGHEMNVYCHLEPDDPAVKCNAKVEATLPLCGHKTEKLCHEDVTKVKCVVLCNYRVESCGHACVQACHLDKDPNHKKYVCKKRCARAKQGCTADLQDDSDAHKCIKLCYETCDPCVVLVSKKRSQCTHKEMVRCNEDVDEKPCNKKCQKQLPCGHFCLKKCSEQCGDCKQMVKKVIPECGHEVRVNCEVTPDRSLCRLPCERVMTCGHRCRGVCGDECAPRDCDAPSGTRAAAPCGHTVTLPCKYAKLPEGDVEESVLLGACTAACAAQLDCGHVCAGSCNACHRGRLHVSCDQTCHQDNICGHQCEEPCNQICPPCKKSCEVRCQHSRCSAPCGEPCVPCQEPCGRRCEHGACERRCGEPCTRPPCDAPCPRMLPCQHHCRGLCGEPCPPVCKLCDPDNFPRDFLGDEYGDDEKFILLQDCGHVREVDEMDQIMNSTSETIELKKCPICRKPVINTGRYKDLVNTVIKRDINPIKTRIYGTKSQIKAKIKEFVQELGEFKTKYATLLEREPHLKRPFDCLLIAVKREVRPSALHADMAMAWLSALGLLAASLAECGEARSALPREMGVQLAMLEPALRPRTLKLSSQRQRDLRRELARLHALVQLARLLAQPQYAASRQQEAVRASAASARAAILDADEFLRPAAERALSALQEACRMAGVLTRQERDMVVRAMAMKAGAWYKCPAGHVYCIGDCGGAMERARCPECGETIGGVNHALALGNAHAGEMDGSHVPAWPPR